MAVVADPEGRAGDGPAHGTNRTRDLISQDLLHELSHEPDDWTEETPAPMPVGFETPSDPGTMSPPRSPEQRPHRDPSSQVQAQSQLQPFLRPEQSAAAKDSNEAARMNANAGAGWCAGTFHAQQVQDTSTLTNGDRWQWKTAAPEFVPGGQQQQPQDPAAAGMWALSPTGASANRGVAMNTMGNLPQLRQEYEWRLHTKYEELQEMRRRAEQMEAEMARSRTTWEAERRTLARSLQSYRSVMERYCIPLEEASDSAYGPGGQAYGLQDDANGSLGPLGTNTNAPPAQSSSAPWTSNGGCGGMGHGSHGGRNDQYGAQLQSQNSSTSTWLQSAQTSAGDGSGAQGPSSTASNSLDSKMRQLNSLLQEGKGASGNRCSDSPAKEQEQEEEEEGDEDEDPEPPIPESSQEHQGVEDAEDRLAQRVRGLEKLTGGQVDERAARALWSLSEGDAEEALSKVDELVQSQGGHCRNLSSILQSVCRKLEKRAGKKAKADGVGGYGGDKASGANDIPVEWRHQ